MRDINEADVFYSECHTALTPELSAIVC